MCRALPRLVYRLLFSWWQGAFFCLFWSIIVYLVVVFPPEKLIFLS